VLDDLRAVRDQSLGLVDSLAVGGPGSVVPIARGLVGLAKQRRERLAEQHALELERLEEAYGVEGPRGWPPGVRTRVEKRFERIAKAEEQRTLRLMLDDLAGYLRDLVALAVGVEGAALINSDAQAALRRDAGRLHRDDLLAAVASVGACREALARNGAPELQFERLLLAIATSLYVRDAA
jgi:DNA polymerase-3 subunit delta'